MNRQPNNISPNGEVNHEGRVTQMKPKLSAVPDTLPEPPFPADTRAKGFRFELAGNPPLAVAIMD